jgi:predicted ATPase
LRHLRDRELLVILDNFEHVLEARILLSELLEASPGLQLLVTSRTALRLTDEHLFKVEPLELPRQTSLEATRGVASVELFVERATAVQPTFRLEARNVAAVAELCRRLDGLPLALELAASRVAVLPPESVLARLGRQLNLASTAPGDLPQRQRTLQATLDWSFDLLEAHAQAAFASLAVFEDGGTFEAVERVTGATPELLMQLADSSLIVIGAPEGDARFGFLETVRAYAAARLPNLVELDALRAKHATFVLEFCAVAEQHLSGPRHTDQDRWIRRLQREHANIRAAMRYTIDRGDLNAAAEALWHIHGFLWSNGHASELDQWSRELRDKEDLLDPVARSRVCYAAGLAAQMRDDLALAEELLQQALELGREVEDQRVVGLCLMLLAYMALPREGVGRAVEMLHASAEHFRLAGDAWGETFTVGGLGELALLAQDLDTARRQFEDYVDRCRARGDQRGLGQGLQVLGHIHLLRGGFARAEALMLEAVPLCRRTNNMDRLALCLRGLACVAAERQHWQQAARLLGAADSLPTTPSWISRQAVHAQAADRVRAELGEQAFERFRGEGRVYPIEELLLGPPSG